jgi:superfamily I DNA/RNA helicase
MNNLKLVLGGPGCGKTTRLLEIVEGEMAAGVPPSAIAFVTFTKAAATEAKERAAEKFGLDPEDDLPWFRTIHSLAYARLGVSRDEILDRRDWGEFGNVVGEALTGMYDTSDGAPVAGGGREIGDLLLRVTDYAATTLMPLESAWRHLNEAVNWHRLQRFADALTAYKQDVGKMDFTDLLRQYADHGDPVPVQVAVIDEAQDLTAAQWACVRRAFETAQRVYVGGDDDQAIYHWAGADVRQFLHLSATPEVLHVSHRLPRAIHTLSQTVAARISARYVKQFAPSDRDGTVEWHQHASAVDFSQPGSWFLLARNTYMLRAMEQQLREMGVPYVRRNGPAVSPTDVKAMQLWERARTGKVTDLSAGDVRALAKALDQPKPQLKESARYTLASFGWDAWAGRPWFEVLIGIPNERRDYYLACLRRGERLTKPARIRLETIHGVKGAEADHVLLMTDMSGRTATSFRLNADNEHRVFYVGVTRALQSLHLVMPQSDQAYPMG